MKLSSFIRDNMEPILQEWEAFARTLRPASKGSTLASGASPQRALALAMHSSSVAVSPAATV